MDNQRKSNFEFFSMGIVTDDKLTNTSYIKVTPIESLSDKDGALNKQNKELTASSKDAAGVSQKATIKTDAVIYAKWLPLSDSNRSTSPDVYKNETVMIYRYADSDDYYWTTVFDENNIRRLETVRYSYSNLKTPLTPYDSDSSYWVEWSTRDKYIKLHTSDNDGESAKYDLLIDTKKGEISLIDNHNNSFYLDSVNRKVTVNSGTGEINFDVETTINTPKITINTDNATVNASNSTTVNCPNNEINGKLHVTGAVTLDSTLNVADNITAPRLIGKADSSISADCC